MAAETVLCILLTCAYSLVFLGSCIQLTRILIAQHDLHSFQCGFLLVRCTPPAATQQLRFSPLPDLLSCLLSGCAVAGSAVVVRSHLLLR